MKTYLRRVANRSIFARRAARTRTIPSRAGKFQALVERCTLLGNDSNPLPTVILPNLRECLNQVYELPELGVGIKPGAIRSRSMPVTICQWPRSPRPCWHHSRHPLRSTSPTRNQQLIYLAARDISGGPGRHGVPPPAGGSSAENPTRGEDNPMKLNGLDEMVGDRK